VKRAVFDVPKIGSKTLIGQQSIDAFMEGKRVTFLPRPPKQPTGRPRNAA
jgi:hypothetical protein